MNKNFILETVKRNTSGVIFTLKKHSPEIMIIAGAIGTVTAAVMACKATTKLPEVLDEAKEGIEEIHEALELNDANYTEKEYKVDLTRAYVKTGVELVKLYGPSVTLGVLSMGTVFASNNILRKRNASLTAAYATVDGAFKRYRKNVVEQYGADADKALRYDIKKQEIEITETDAKGKEKTVKKTVDVSGMDPTQYSEYAKFFDEGCKEWTKDPEYNLAFLLSQQNYVNDALKSKGHIFLNEVYDLLGIRRTKAGQLVGWIYDENNPVGDNFIDFGIYDCYKQPNKDFVNGYERSILLDFNVDGDILSKI